MVPPLSVNSLTGSDITTTSLTLNYSLTNSSNITVYLYQRIGATIGSTLESDSTLVQTLPLSTAGTISNTYSATSLTPNTIYSYGFYDGNTSGSSTLYATTITIKTDIDNTSFSLTTTPSQITVNYSLTNSTSNTLTAYLYRYNSSSASSTLNTSSGSFITGITLNAGQTITDTYLDSVSSSNSYAYAFYDGSVDGTSTILSNLTGTNQSASTYTFATISSLSTTYISTSTTSYLYQFTGSSAPSTDPTSGTLIGSGIITSSSGVSSSTINETSLTANQQYTYAFYDNNDSSAVMLKNGSNVGLSTTFTTTNILNTSLSASNVNAISATLTYTITNTNSSASSNIYLYRFAGTSAPSTLSGGTWQTTLTITPNYNTTSTFTDNSLTINNNYTYAFYLNNSPNSAILTSDGSTAISQTIDTTFSTVAFTSPTLIRNTTATINFTLSNQASTTITCYLYYFTSTPSSTLTVANGTYVSSAETSGSSASIDITGLSGGTLYYFAFYDGNTDGSKIITNNLAVNQYSSLTTTNLYNTALTASTVLNTKITVSYTLTNVGGSSFNAYLYKFSSSAPSSVPSQTAYLYRFTGSTAPTSNPTTGTNPTSVVVSSNNSSSSTYTNTGLTANTTYTYAFYNGISTSRYICLYFIILYYFFNYFIANKIIKVYLSFHLFFFLFYISLIHSFSL